MILSFNGHDIDKVRDLPIVVAETPVGQKADVQVWRKNGETTLSPKIAAMPDNPQIARRRGQRRPRQWRRRRAEQQRHGLAARAADRTNGVNGFISAKSVKGVVVTSVADNSPLAELGLRRGDVIESINQQPVTTPEEVGRPRSTGEERQGRTRTC